MMPIHNSSTAPMIFRKGMASRAMAKKISTTRMPMAPAVPYRMPRRRCDGGSLRQASAMMTALSPANTRSMSTMARMADRNSEVRKSMGASV